VRLQIDGAEAVALDGDALRIVTGVGDIRLPLLRVVDGAGRAIETDGLTPEASAGVITAPFAAAATLQESPAAGPTSPEDDPADLLYSTFLGGSSDD
jgi:hypothetical protein